MSETTDRATCGWCRDLPSHRDFTPQQPSLRRVLQRLPQRSSRCHVGSVEQVDWREFCPPVMDQTSLPTSSAHACIAMVQYYERRSSGKLLSPSRLFVHENACRLSGLRNDRVSLRATLKAMVRFGCPPERHWPYGPERFLETPDAFAYSFNRQLHRCRYARLDGGEQTGRDTLAIVKSFLAVGFTCVFGLVLPESLNDGPDICFPTRADKCCDGHAVFCVGYDDHRRIRSDKGALLIQNSWGESWGDGGFGWVPYRYVLNRLAVDFWVILRPRWLNSGEFYRPS